jgi:hypothetical protein
MGGIVGNKWSSENCSPMEAIPTAVCLTTYAGVLECFMRMPLQEMADQITAVTLHIQVGKVFHIDQIVESLSIEENKAGGKIVMRIRTNAAAWVGGRGAGS